MNATKIAVIWIALALASPAFAQASNQPQQGMQPRTSGAGVGAYGSRGGVAIQPNNNNPFKNPIGQGVPPAVSANPARNGNQISAPR